VGEQHVRVTELRAVIHDDQSCLGTALVLPRDVNRDGALPGLGMGLDDECPRIFRIRSEDITGNAGIKLAVLGLHYELTHRPLRPAFDSTGLRSGSVVGTDLEIAVAVRRLALTLPTPYLTVSLTTW
jgi:hypothetical protein